MKDGKCNNCGAVIDVSSGEKCEYCGAIIAKEDNRPIIINNYYTVEKNGEQSVENEKFKDSSNSNIEETGLEKLDLEINLVLCVFLFIISPIIGVLYLLYKINKAHKRKREDDD